MNEQKCPVCDGYGVRPRPDFVPGTGPLECRVCAGLGVVAPAAAPLEVPAEWLGPPRPAELTPPDGPALGCHRLAAGSLLMCACPCCVGQCPHGWSGARATWTTAGTDGLPRACAASTCDPAPEWPRPVPSPGESACGIPTWTPEERARLRAAFGLLDLNIAVRSPS